VCKTSIHKGPADDNLLSKKQCHTQKIIKQDKDMLMKLKKIVNGLKQDTSKKKSSKTVKQDNRQFNVLNKMVQHSIKTEG
jgi:ribosomal protein S19